MLSRYQAIPMTDGGELPMQAVCLSRSVSVIEADREKWMARTQALEAALTKVHGIVAEYWGPCPGSVETLLTIRDVLGTKDWRPNVDFMPRLLTQTETKGESMFKPLKDGLCVTCGRDARNHDFGGACRTGSAMEDLAALNRSAVK